MNITNAKSALEDVVMSEDDSLNLTEYELFITKFNDVSFKVDFNFMNENKVSDYPPGVVDHFNNTLIELRRKRNISLFSVLTQLSIHCIDPSKIRSLINAKVKMLLVDELRDDYPKIRALYPTNDFF